MSETLDEGVFRARLNELIRDYDGAHPDADDGEGNAQRWDDAFESLLVEATNDQSKRALALLELHVKNRHEAHR